MKTIALCALLLSATFTPAVRAQSTTGGGSGGSTASTGATYSTSQLRAPEGSPQSMTVADEGASRGYILGPRVGPDHPTRNRAMSPNGSTDATEKPAGRKPASSTSSTGKPQSTSGSAPRSGARP